MADAAALKAIRQRGLGAPPTQEDVIDLGPDPRPRIDGRTLRKTGRKLQMNLRVTDAFDLTLRQMAQDERRLMIEVLEDALALYVRQQRAQEAAE